MSKCRAAAAKLPASTTCLNTAMLTSRSMVPLRNLASETPKRTTDCPAVSAPPLAVSRTSKGDNLDKEEIMRTAIDTVIVGGGPAGGGLAQSPLGLVYAQYTQLADPPARRGVPRGRSERLHVARGSDWLSRELRRALPSPHSLWGPRRTRAPRPQIGPVFGRD